jgi:hypothetical protein
MEGQRDDEDAVEIRVPLKVRLATDVADLRIRAEPGRRTSRCGERSGFHSASAVEAVHEESEKSAAIQLDDAADELSGSLVDAEVDDSRLESPERRREVGEVDGGDHSQLLIRREGDEDDVELVDEVGEDAVERRDEDGVGVDKK